MEVRLNKLISDSGLCSRREADKFIEEGRVTVNGSLPHIGQKVTEADIVMLDDIQVRIGKHTGKQTSSARINIQELELAGQSALYTTKKQEAENLAKQIESEQKTVADLQVAIRTKQDEKNAMMLDSANDGEVRQKAETYTKKKHNKTLIYSLF